MKLDYITLNFLEKYYPFYEWLISDNYYVEQNIYLYRISSESLDKIINYKICLSDKTFLEKHNCVLFTDDFAYVAIKFDNNGISKYKSSLLISDEIKISEKFTNLNVVNIDFTIIEEMLCEDNLRITENIKNVIQNELKSIIKQNDVDKLKYLYYEWFNENDVSFGNMVSKIERRLLSSIGETEKRIYNMIINEYRLV